MKKHPAAAIQSDNTVMCPTCRLPHALFYERSSDTKQKLFYLCNKAQRKWFDAEGYAHLKRCTHKAPVEFIADLPIAERWTKKYAKEVQARKQLVTA